MGDSKPNIILIMTDQQRYDYVGYMGHPQVKTPHLDELACQSTVFENAYCASPVCGPARASIFTGMYPSAHGVVRNHICLSCKRPLLTDRLAEAGYFNALIGKLHLSPCRSRHGFDFKALCDSPHAVYDPEEIVLNPYREWVEKELFNGDSSKAEMVISESERKASSDPDFWIGYRWCDEAHHLTTWTGDQAVAFISGWQKAKPLFLNISFFGPHHPYSTCEPWDSLYDPDAVRLPQTLVSSLPGPFFEYINGKRSRKHWSIETWKRIIALYQGAISQIDFQIGRILKAIKQRGLWENSIIIFVADHGDELGDFGYIGKDLMTEGSSRVPLMIKPRGQTSGGNRCQKIVNSLDLFATILELSGQKNWKRDEDGDISSRSLVSLLEGKEQWDNHTFVMHGVQPQNSWQMVRKDNLKLIRLNVPNKPSAYEMYDMTDSLPDSRNVFEDLHYRRDRDILFAALNQWWQRQLDIFPDSSVLRRLSVRQMSLT